MLGTMLINSFLALPLLILCTVLTPKNVHSEQQQQQRKLCDNFGWTNIGGQCYRPFIYFVDTDQANQLCARVGASVVSFIEEVPSEFGHLVVDELSVTRELRLDMPGKKNGVLCKKMANNGQQPTSELFDKICPDLATKWPVPATGQQPSTVVGSGGNQTPAVIAMLKMAEPSEKKSISRSTQASSSTAADAGDDSPKKIPPTAAVVAGRHGTRSGGDGSGGGDDVIAVAQPAAIDGSIATDGGGRRQHRQQQQQAVIADNEQQQKRGGRRTTHAAKTVSAGSAAAASSENADEHRGRHNHHHHQQQRNGNARSDTSVVVQIGYPFGQTGAHTNNNDKQSSASLSGGGTGASSSASNSDSLSKSSHGNSAPSFSSARSTNLDETDSTRISGTAEEFDDSSIASTSNSLGHSVDDSDDLNGDSLDIGMSSSKMSGKSDKKMASKMAIKEGNVKADWRKGNQIIGGSETDDEYSASSSASSAASASFAANAENNSSASYMHKRRHFSDGEEA